MGRAVLQVGEGLGWIYGICLVTYMAGLFASMWRLRRLRSANWYSMEGAALAALAFGWPTALRAQAELRAGTRDVRSLLTPRRSRVLVVFAGALLPVFALVMFLPTRSDSWAMVEVPLGLLAVAVACLAWLVDAR